MIDKVISGGQTGADIAGVRAAKRVGIDTGGFMPRGFRTLDGAKPEYEYDFNMVAIDDHRWPERTRLNVMRSDCTIRFAKNFLSAGERCTMRYIRKYAKPVIDLNSSQLTILATNTLVSWLIKNDFKIVNVAGNSEKTAPGIEAAVEQFLVPVFERVQFGE